MVSSSKMKPISSACSTSDLKSKSCLFSLLITASVMFMLYFIGELYITGGFKGTLLRSQAVDAEQNLKPSKCKNQNRSLGTEFLPEGIVARTSDLEMQPLWSSGFANRKGKAKASKSLLAMAIGIKQKEIVDKIVRKFPRSDFTVMVFHYDGVVDEWKDMSWNDEAIHVSAGNQTKWWFAKRFLHPDIVADYEYIFLWDEDLGVDNFNLKRYISIIKEEGLEISQPALDLTKSKVNHKITIRLPNSRVHRKTYSFKQRTWCSGNAPPCTGWVEMMAPVFSRAAWRCAWHMIQNDLNHGWGLDMKLGYCAQGDPGKKVGVVDEEYITHLGLPTLGGKAENQQNISETRSSQQEQFSEAEVLAPSESPSARQLVRMQSHMEWQKFNQRWQRAAKKDSCWIDPFRKTSNLTAG